MPVTRRRTARPSVARARRTRVSVEQDTASAYDDVVAQLKILAEIERARAETNDHYDRAEKVAKEVIAEAFKRGKLDEADDGIMKARMHTPPGRSSTEFDPQKFKKYVGDDAFWKCVKIGVTEAKQFVSEKEMTRAGAIVTPAKPGKPTLVVERIKKKK